MFEELIYIVEFTQTLAKGPVLIKNRCISRCSFFDTFNSVDECIFGNSHSFFKNFPKFILVSLRF